MSSERINEYLTQFSQTRSSMLDQLRRVVVGQSEVIEQILAAVFTRGHCLLVGVPGLAKTLMVSSISQILDVSFKRIQFTPDLMPSDITGTMVLDESESGKREFRFVRGPIFANIVLADEINRTPPKTQAALLQAMQEREVTAGQDTYKLPDPFFVIATQNPIEQEGTYPLPEAQLDRFMFTIKVDYPSLEEEKRILSMTSKSEAVELTKVLSSKAISNLQKLILGVPVGDYVLDYIARLVRATRPSDPTAPDFVKKMVDYGADRVPANFCATAARRWRRWTVDSASPSRTLRKWPSPCCAIASARISRLRRRARRARTLFNSCSPSSASRRSANTRNAADESMISWYRIFGSSSVMPAPAAILEFLTARTASVSGDFAADDCGWYRADLVIEGTVLQLERYLAEEPGIRAELNSWAAWLETRTEAAEHVGLMERMIQTAQLFTLRSDQDSPRTEGVCVELCRFLAETTAGVYQIDERGFFSVDGRLLVAE